MKILMWLLLILISVSSLSYSNAKNVPVKVLDVEHILDFNNLNPSLNPNDFIHLNYVWAIDNSKQLYFIDRSKHRVLKFKKDGTFLLQIGSIGQDDKDLFNPSGIFLHNNHLYVLDQDGQKLKKFSLTGQFIATVPLNKEAVAKSFFVTDDLIFLNEINKKDNTNLKLVSIYSMVGKKVKEIGEANKVDGFGANVMFNSIYFYQLGNVIYGSFNYVPRFFRVKLDGAEPFYKELTFTEIEEIKAEGTKRGVQTVESLSTKDVGRTGSMTYCYGFAVNDKKEIFYSTNYDKAQKGLIFHMNEDGDLIGKILLRLNNVIANPLKLLIIKNDYYAIVKTDKIFHLVKFNPVVANGDSN